MLIFISDIHLNDGTAAPANVSSTALIETLREIGTRAREAQVNEITLVFLGDIFDLIRTEAWFQVLPEERPWGEKPSEQAALDILERVLEANPEILACFEKDYVADFGFPVKPRTVYVPGNHDRLCNLYASLKKRVCEILRLTDAPPPGVPFPTYFLDLPHATFARHGHEWDDYNFEGSPALKTLEWQEIAPEDYAKTPIGDVLACEVASRLPIVVLEMLPEGHGQRKFLADRMRDLFDVRPLLGMLPWLDYQVKVFDDPEVTEAISSSIRLVVNDFARIPFVEKWFEEHCQMLNPFSSAGQLRTLVRALQDLDFRTIEKVLPLVNKISALIVDDNYASKTIDDFKRLDSVAEWNHKILYILYGHTHEPEQQAISMFGPAGQERGRVYLNTGAWRSSHDQGLQGGFVTWKNLTYTIIYRADERPGSGAPTFEVWTGALKDL